MHERAHWIPVSKTGCVDYHRKQASWHLAVAANIRIVNKHLSFTTAVNVLQIAGVGIMFAMSISDNQENMHHCRQALVRDDSFRTII